MNSVKQNGTVRSGGQHALPYNESRCSRAQALTSLLYSGEAFDSRVGLQYLRARWYDPNAGRFNRLDPFSGNLHDPQSFHKYLYVHGDPISATDPTGMMTLPGALTTTLGAARIVANVGAQIGAIYGGIRSFTDTLLDPTATWEDVVWNTVSGSAQGLVMGYVGGFLGALAFAAGAPWAIGLTVVVGGYGLYNNGQGVIESFSNERYLQGSARLAFTVIDALLAFGGLRAANTGNSTGPKGALGGEKVDTVSLNVVGSLLRVLGVKMVPVASGQPVSYGGSGSTHGARYTRIKGPNGKITDRQIRYEDGEMTWYMLVHELAHVAYESYLGPKTYGNTGTPLREAFALEFLQKLWWNRMTAAEHNHAVKYAEQ